MESAGSRNRNRVEAILLLGLGGAGAIAAFVLALAFARSAAGLALVVAVGALLLAVWLGWLLAGSEEDCHECRSLLGERVPVVALVIGLLNAVGWLAGALAGAAARRLHAGRG